MNANDIDGFLKDVKSSIGALGKRRDTDIGFNAFALVSDVYYRENFHSDVIAAILNPDSPHGEGKRFLRLFVQYLERVARIRGMKLADTLAELSLEGSIRVAREEGHIDIKIEAVDWTIIVENKINGANDMERQIPRYIRDCGGPERVKAVVYLNAAAEVYPSRLGWADEDIKIIDACLLPIVGYSETKSVPNLVEGWLEPCELAAKSFAARSVIAQYIELVVNHARDTMDQIQLENVANALAENRIDYTKLLGAMQSLPNMLADKIAKNFGGKEGVKDSWVWRDVVAVLDLENIKPSGGDGKTVRFSIDVDCSKLERRGIMFFSRTQNAVPLTNYETLLKGFDSEFHYDKVEDRIVLPISTNQVFLDIGSFIERIDKLVMFLCQKRSELQNIAGGVV